MLGTVLGNMVEGLGKAIHDSPSATACVVNRLYSYGVGRAPTREEFELLKYFEKGFAEDGYRLAGLLRRIALSDALYDVLPDTSEPAAPGAQAATNSR